MMIKYSIILPVYNAEIYLEKCIKSILNQEYSKIELILINDGSTDNSENICKNYLYDHRVKYIYQKNRGVSNARNKGIQIAKGEYILFIDSDDYVEKDYLKVIDSNIKDNDLLIFGYKRVFRNKEIDFIPRNINSINDLMNSVIENDCVGGYLWNKVYKKGILISNNLEFDPKISFCEDLLFTVLYLKNIRKFKIIEHTLYNYRMRKSSITSDNNNLTKKKSVLDALSLIYEELSDSKEKECIAWLYINNFYRLKLKSKKSINKILLQEKNIIKNKGQTEKMKFIFLKNFPIIYRLIIKIKNKKYNFYE